jgi:hypothetical protein
MDIGSILRAIGIFGIGIAIMLCKKSCLNYLFVIGKALALKIFNT